ncbi:molybdopterin converting factor [Paenibacillus psychroresistens]|uniref:Molybdopterin synthase catalytic subunit n=1 Tax=Paenibacillus psychroresistens TaxID=1778678 RepID=A0A6B8RND5_9BACL|nr:molybdenum cofactor biosynthesis protein MoaE [Paenibacillus psychroresistens]QGQ97830.1 molybdopterin converting factor [Paenibacillus psychroresistens]
MKLTIHLFAGLAESIGHTHITLTVKQTQITVAQLKELLIQEYPNAAQTIAISFIAINQAYASADDLVSEENEIALIPPVSGGEAESVQADSVVPHSLFQITHEPISVEKVSQTVITPLQGATLTFIGTTREFTFGKRTILLEYEAYVPMAIAAMQQIGTEITAQWPGALCAITHRLGRVAIAEISVVIAVSAPHRADCYDASRYAIERLKQIVPIWKKEIWEDGSEWKGHQQGTWDPTVNPVIKAGPADE